VTELNAGVGDLTARALLDRARADLGPAAFVELGRDMICALQCAACDTDDPFYSSLGKVTQSHGRCPRCGQMRAPKLYSTIRGDEPFLDRTLADLGIPEWDIVSARNGEAAAAYEFAGDRVRVLGSLAEVRS
jgi:adenylyltransferase/sulfurtransferase